MAGGGNARRVALSSARGRLEWSQLISLLLHSLSSILLPQERQKSPGLGSESSWCHPKAAVSSCCGPSCPCDKAAGFAVPAICVFVRFPHHHNQQPKLQPGSGGALRKLPSNLSGFIISFMAPPVQTHHRDHHSPE